MTSSLEPPDAALDAGAGPGPSYDLERVRREIPLLERFAVLNNCSQGPQTERARAAAREFLDSWDRDGMDWERWLEEVERARAAFAALIHASPDEVAVCSSVSDATARLASALGFSGRRRKVVASGAEFPTVGHVWLGHRRFGAEVEWVPVDDDGAVPLAGYEEAIDGRTRIVSACHAAYANGALQDVAAIAERAHGAGSLLYVDAYQTLGVLPVDVEALGVDFLASGNLKYLLGTAGIAFLYVRRGLIETLEPAATGWLARADPFAFRLERLDWAPTARRFDGGTPPVLPAYLARAGMETILELGPDAIADWTGRLSRRLLAGAAERGLRVHGPRDPERKTPSTAILVPGEAPGAAHRVEAALRERGVLASARGRAVRLAPHLFTTPEEVDRALDLLAEVVEEAAIPP